MRFDPAMMQALLQLDDAALWKKICQITAQGGIALSETPPPPEELAKLRSLAGGCGQADVAQAVEKLSRYRRKG